MDQSALQELVGDGGDERTAEMQMVGNAVDADIAFLGRQVTDRDQNRVFDADQADARTVSGAHRFMARKQSKKIVHQLAEMPVRSVHQQFRPGDRQGRLRRERGRTSYGSHPGAALFGNRAHWLCLAHLIRFSK